MTDANLLPGVVSSVAGDRVHVAMVGGDPVPVQMVGAAPLVGQPVQVLRVGKSFLAVCAPNPPRLRARAATATVPSGTVTYLEWQVSEVADRVTWTGTTITVQDAGIYTVSGRGQFAGAFTPEQRAHMSVFMDGVEYRSPLGGGEESVSVAATLGLSAGATVRLSVFQNTGSAGTFQSTRVTVVKIGEL